MKPAIITKINQVLSKPFKSEMQVVYLLVELRKLIELEKASKRFPALNFFCRWALHSKGKGVGADRILVRFDGLPEKIKANPGVSTWDELQEIRNTINFSRFQSDLAKFMDKQEIISSLWTDPFLWSDFLTLYIQVIENCPLVLSPTSKTILKSYSHLNVELINHPVRPTELYVMWTMLDSDGKRVEALKSQISPAS